MKILIEARGNQLAQVEVCDQFLCALVLASLGPKYNLSSTFRIFSDKPMDPSGVYLAVVSVEEREYSGKEFQFLEKIMTAGEEVTYRHIGSLDDTLYLSKGGVSISKKTGKEITIENPTPLTELGASTWKDATESNIARYEGDFYKNHILLHGEPWKEYQADALAASYVLSYESVIDIHSGQEKERTRLVKEAYSIWGKNT